MASVKFNNSDALFFNTLRERIDSYFTKNNKQTTGDFRLYLKTVILMVSMIGCYSLLIFFTPASGWLSLGLCVVMGGIISAVGFNIMHDGAHGSYSQYKWLNECMAYALNMMGGNTFIWRQKHNINHHSYTNVEGMDDDIDIKPFIRVHV